MGYDRMGMSQDDSPVTLNEIHEAAALDIPNMRALSSSDHVRTTAHGPKRSDRGRHPARYRGLGSSESDLVRTQPRTRAHDGIASGLDAANRIAQCHLTAHEFTASANQRVA
jgi:hypothetical protein